jgi:hypothetical protein
MERRKFKREFKLEAVRLIEDQGPSTTNFGSRAEGWSLLSPRNLYYSHISLATIVRYRTSELSVGGHSLVDKPLC